MRVEEGAAVQFEFKSFEWLLAQGEGVGFCGEAAVVVGVGHAVVDEDARVPRFGWDELEGVGEGEVGVERIA